jgi:2'-5' RNA ligase
LSATVEGDARVRLFLALRLPETVLDELVAWQLRELSGGRIVPREHLHVTLAFLGHRPRGELPAIVAELRAAAAAAEPMRLTVDRKSHTP